MHRMVKNHADRLIHVWHSFPIISYSLGASRIWHETWLLRPATIEDAPELYRALKSSRQIMGRDFGLVPCLMNDDTAVVSLAKRRIPDYDKEMQAREIRCSSLLEILAMSDDSRAAITSLAADPGLALAVA